MSIKIEEAEEVIKKLANKFDTHKFIEKYIRMYEWEYVKLLYPHFCKKEIGEKGTFRDAHAEIGKFLAKNAKEKEGVLKIKKMDRDDSENIKKYKSSNQEWRKIK